MLALSISLVLATSPLPPPPLVSAEAEAPRSSGRSARLLDAQSQAALLELERREAALQPTSSEKTFRVLGVISLSLALLPVAAAAVGLVVGIFVGAAVYGVAGAFLGMFLGVWAVVAIIPWPVWLLAAGLGVAAPLLFGAAAREGAGNARELALIRAERRAILHPTPLATVATF